MFIKNLFLIKNFNEHIKFKYKFIQNLKGLLLNIEQDSYHIIRFQSNK